MLVYRDQEAIHPNRPEEHSRMTRNRGKRVLVIDDDEEVRIAVRHALSRAGYDVEAIADVPAAVRASASGD